MPFLKLVRIVSSFPEVIAGVPPFIESMLKMDVGATLLSNTDIYLKTLPPSQT